MFNRRFNVTLDDCPGGIAQLCQILADIGVTIKDIMHERAWLKDIYSVEVTRFQFPIDAKDFIFVCYFGLIFFL